MLLLFLTFSVLVAKPKKLLYTVANPARGLLNREKSSIIPPPPTLLVRRKNKITRQLRQEKKKISCYILETVHN